MALIDNGVYVHGRRVETPKNLDETYRMLDAAGGIAWIGLYRPSPEEVASVAREFDLHPLAVEDALSGHQRSKVERYGDTLFAVLRPARYRDKEESIEFGELHLFIGPDFVVTIRHAESPNLAAVRRRMEANPELLAMGPEAVFYAILDEVVDDDDDALSRRIYELSREVINFQRAVHPLSGMLEWLRRGSEKYRIDEELQRSLRDVLDHTIRVNERVDSFRAILENALTVQSALVARRHSEAGLAQNDEIKKISSWAAIIFAPTLVGTVYGMNFDVMPELHWAFGYPMAIGAMAAFAVGLYGVFKYKRWL
ncbi:unnamed protein product [Penicillium discolor]